jgi:hypothetical protein
MTKKYRIRLEGKQREQIDADLMAQLVVMFGRQLAEDARQAAEVARDSQTADEADRDAKSDSGREETQ